MNLPNERLIKYYKTLGFTRLSPEDEKYVHAHIKPKTENAFLCTRHYKFYLPISICIDCWRWTLCSIF